MHTATQTRMIAAIARLTMLEVSRNRFWQVVGIIVVAGFLLARFTGQLAVMEVEQMQGALTAATLRIAIVVALGLMVVTSMNREFNDKNIELMFSLSLPRHTYFLGKLAGYLLISVLSAVPLGILLSLFAPIFQALLWSLSLVCELLLVAAMALVLVFTFGQVITATGALFAFYFLARGIGAMQLMAHGPLTDHTSRADQVMGWLVDGIAYLMPDLGAFTRTDWLIYPGTQWGELPAIAGQTAIYLILLTMIALFDLYRREF